MPPEQSAAVAARLRDAADSIRRKPTPLADLIPLLQQAADALDEAQRDAARLRAKVARLALYENMADEFGLTAFPDCAAWQQTLEAISEGRVMPRDGTHTHVETVAAYQALARRALDGAARAGDAA